MSCYVVDLCGASNLLLEAPAIIEGELARGPALRKEATTVGRDPAEPVNQCSGSVNQH
jgi:hypothetical protein